MIKLKYKWVSSMLITFNDVSLQYTDKLVLNKVNFTINDNSKVGIIGLNGSGKSTILKLMVGTLEPSSGIIYRKSNLRIGYLSQDIEYIKGKTIFEEIKRLSKSENDYELLSMLNRLGLTNHNMLVDNMSGGEKKRLHLASVLVSNTDMLILDEPTNHLDIAMICWLEKFLIKYNKGLVLVTHDRFFLERVTKEIMEIENGKVCYYLANYSHFIELKSERLEYLKANERKLSSILKKEAKWMKMNPQARSTKSRERIERFYESESTLKEVQTYISNTQREMELESKTTRIGRKTIIIEDLSLAVNNQILFTNFSYIVNRFDRLGIIGKNGCGKTSFLNSIVGQIEPQNGKITIGETINIGYFKQINHIEDESMKVIDYLRQYGEYIDTLNGKISTSELLESYFFTPTMQQLPISRLSGGEKRRLGLLKVLITNPNVLLLDEPTNDFDIYTIQVLEDYLESFKGAVIVISHDRYFLDKVCNHLMVFNNKSISEYMFSISDFLTKHEDILMNVNVKQSKENQSSSIEIPRFTSREKKEYDHIEEEIEIIENQIKEIKYDIDHSGTDYELLMSLNEQLEAKQNELEEKIKRWEYLEDINQKIIKYRKEKYNE